MRVELDHLVVAARTLAEGIGHVKALTGAAPAVVCQFSIAWRAGYKSQSGMRT